MKYLIVSDIHGSSNSAEIIVEKFNKLNCDKILILGDILYHGPRNDLASNYNPKRVIEILNKLDNKIIAIRGNCDAEVDQMVLNFPMLCDYTLISDEGVRIYVTHGHIYNKENPLKLLKNDLLVCGHTHVLGVSQNELFTYLNPGSVSIPKENNPPSYMTYENRVFRIKGLDKKIIKEWSFENASK